MKINEFNDDILEKGFEIPKISDALIIIMLTNKEIIYHFFLLIFYLLGCFKLRYYQYGMINPWMGMNQLKRMVSFHPKEWNPFSFVAVFVFSILNFFYDRENLINIEINSAIVVDIDKNNKIYVANIIK